MDLTELAARVRRLEDLEAVRSTWLDYCNRLDAQDFAALGDVGTDDAEVETQVVCVDRRRQWRKAGNIRHSAAIRSGMYAMTAPARLLAARSTRRTPEE